MYKMMKRKRFLSYVWIAALLAALCLAGTVDASAQKQRRYPKRTYFGRSVSPAEDSLVMVRMKDRLDSIRQTRPTVALVLSGGGAKGAAHIGVLHYLDSLKIPVDVVLGTSIGGLMGGLTSMGYNYREIDTLIRSLDWEALMRDKLPREYISYERTKYREKYLIAMPFYYEDEALDIEPAKRLNAELHLDADDEHKRNALTDNLMGSLPSGYVYGQNISNLFSSLTVGYQDPMDFMDLPIPYACVSTDLSSGKTKVWYDGPLNTALRSTMSIPGVFTPVKYGKMVLVDGGMRDNYPTDIAKQLGADIIIGVDVTSPPKPDAKVRNLGDIVSLSMDMLEREVYERNVYIPDVSIRPDLMGLNMLSFSKENIDKLIHNGYEAARENDSILVAIKRRVGDDSLRLAAPHAINLRNHPVAVNSVSISGVNSKAARILLKKIDIEPGDTVSYEKISHVIAQIYATGAYDYVSYELRGKQEPFDLAIACKMGPVHMLGVGARADTEEFATAVLNIGLFANRIQGSKLNLDARLSMNPEVKLRYSYDSPSFPTINVSASARWTQAKMFVSRNDWPMMDFFSSRQEVSISGLKWSYFDINCGVRNDLFYDNTADPFLASRVADPSMNFRQEACMPMDAMSNYMSVFVGGKVDNFDRGYFPNRGVKFALSYDWTFTDYKRMLPYSGLHTLRLDFSAVLSTGKIFAFIPYLGARMQFGPQAPLVYANMVGGQVEGRYFEQQIPFMGIPKVMSLDGKVGIARADFRFNVAKNHYITGIFNTLYTFDKFKTLSKGTGMYGGAIEYSYNTIFGPLTANINWSDKIHHVGFYLSFGYNF